MLLHAYHLCKISSTSLESCSGRGAKDGVRKITDILSDIFAEVEMYLILTKQVNIEEKQFRKTVQLFAQTNWCTVFL
jgi:hypothetical protein